MPELEHKRPITMRDVAKAAGVNPSTVSRALRNDRNVSKKRRDEIRLVADRLEYRPNPFVQAFTAHVRGYRSLPTHAPIALLDTGADEHHGRNKEYIRGAMEQASGQGFKIEVLNKSIVTGPLPRVKDILLARGIRALLVMPPSKDIHMKELAGFPVAMATIDYRLKEPNLHRAAASYSQNVEIALNQCTQKGYKRIGFCTYKEEGNPIGMYGLGHYCGWREQQDPASRLSVHFSPHAGKREEGQAPQNCKKSRDNFYRWLEFEKPDVLISNHGVFYEWFTEKGLRCPEEMGFVHLDLRPGDLSFSGLDQNHGQIGAEAVDLLISQLQKNQQGVPPSMQTVLVQGRWVDNGTTRSSEAAP